MGVMCLYRPGGDNGFTGLCSPPNPQSRRPYRRTAFHMSVKPGQSVNTGRREAALRAGAEREEKGRRTSEFGRLSRSESKKFPKAIL